MVHVHIKPCYRPGRDLRTNLHAAADRHPNGDFDGYSHADSFTNGFHSYTNADTHARGWQSNINKDIHTTRNIREHSYADSDSRCNVNKDAHATSNVHEYTYADTDLHSHAWICFRYSCR